MAFKTAGVDFAKISLEMEEKRSMPPEEREMLERREQFERNVRYVLKDEELRASRSKDVRVLRLAELPSSRYDIDGALQVSLHYDAGGGRIGKAMVLSSEAERISRNASSEPSFEESLIARLDRGSTVTLLGHDRNTAWRDSSGKWKHGKEFLATKIAEGALKREQMVSLRHGSASERLVDAARSYDAASTPEQKENVARRYLGQPSNGAGPSSVAKGAPEARLPADRSKGASR